MNFIKKYKEDKEFKQDLQISVLVSAPPLVAYTAALIGYSAAASMGYMPPLTLQKALEPMACFLPFSLGLGSFCFYVRRDIRKALKKMQKQQEQY